MRGINEIYGELAEASISPSMREIQIAVMLRLSMALKVVEGRLVLECPLRSRNSAEWLQKAIKEAYKIDSQLKRIPRGSAGFIYCLHVEGLSAKKLLVSTGLLDRRTRRVIPGFPAFARTPIIPVAAAMWRGAFMAQGELNPEKKKGMEVYCLLPKLAEELKEAASILGIGVQINAEGKGEGVEVVPAKQSVKLLNLLGAREWAIKVCNVYDQKDADVKHVVSQLYEANKKRSSEASQNACERIRRAFKILEGKEVNPTLLQAGRLRLQYPEATLSELGQLADPPISKDALAGRMRRLYRLAMDVKEAQG